MNREKREERMHPDSEAQTDAITELLGRWQTGESAALDDLIPKVYQQLQQLARRAMRRERPDHTLQATALVHEMFVRLTEGAAPEWQDRAHFFAVAARLMRRILVDHARGVRAEKRGGGWHRLTLGALDRVDVDAGVDLLDLDSALHELAQIDPRKAKVIELRSFAGLNVSETAEILNVSKPTVILDTRLAKAWLYRRLFPDREQDDGSSDR